jgi:hypothetical protein
MQHTGTGTFHLAPNFTYQVIDAGYLSNSGKQVFTGTAAQKCERFAHCRSSQLLSTYEQPCVSSSQDEGQRPGAQSVDYQWP